VDTRGSLSLTALPCPATLDGDQVPSLAVLVGKTVEESPQFSIIKLDGVLSLR